MTGEEMDQFKESLDLVSQRLMQAGWLNRKIEYGLNFQLDWTPIGLERIRQLHAVLGELGQLQPAELITLTQLPVPPEVEAAASP